MTSDLWWIVNSIIAALALLLAGITIMMKLLDQNLTVREHNEFSRSVNQRLLDLQTAQHLYVETKEFDDWRMQFHRDFDRIDKTLHEIRDDIRVLAQTEVTRVATMKLSPS